MKIKKTLRSKSYSHDQLLVKKFEMNEEVRSMKHISEILFEVTIEQNMIKTLCKVTVFFFK